MRSFFAESRLAYLSAEAPEPIEAPKAENADGKKAVEELGKLVEDINQLSHVIDDFASGVEPDQRERIKKYIATARQILKDNADNIEKNEQKTIADVLARLNPGAIDPALQNANAQMLKEWYQKLKEQKETNMTAKPVGKEGSFVTYDIDVPANVQMIQWDLSRDVGGELRGDSFSVDPATGRRYSKEQPEPVVIDGKPYKRWTIHLKEGSGFHVIGFDQRRQVYVRKDILVPKEVGEIQREVRPSAQVGIDGGMPDQEVAVPPASPVVPEIQTPPAPQSAERPVPAMPKPTLPQLPAAEPEARPAVPAAEPPPIVPLPDDQPKPKNNDKPPSPASQPADAAKPAVQPENVKPEEKTPEPQKPKQSVAEKPAASVEVPNVVPPVQSNMQPKQVHPDAIQPIPKETPDNNDQQKFLKQKIEMVIGETEHQYLESPNPDFQAVTYIDQSKLPDSVKQKFFAKLDTFGPGIYVAERDGKVGKIGIGHMGKFFDTQSIPTLKNILEKYTNKAPFDAQVLKAIHSEILAELQKIPINFANVSSKGESNLADIFQKTKFAMEETNSEFTVRRYLFEELRNLPRAKEFFQKELKSDAPVIRVVEDHGGIEKIAITAGLRSLDFKKYQSLQDIITSYQRRDFDAVTLNQLEKDILKTMNEIDLKNLPNPKAKDEKPAPVAPGAAEPEAPVPAEPKPAVVPAEQPVPKPEVPSENGDKFVANKTYMEEPATFQYSFETKHEPLFKRAKQLGIIIRDESLRVLQADLIILKDDKEIGRTTVGSLHWEEEFIKTLRASVENLEKKQPDVEPAAAPAQQEKPAGENKEVKKDAKAALQEPVDADYKIAKSLTSDANTTIQDLENQEKKIDTRLNEEPTNPWYLTLKARYLVEIAKRNQNLNSDTIKQAVALQAEALKYAGPQRGDSEFNKAFMEYSRIANQMPAIELRYVLAKPNNATGGSNGVEWEKNKELLRTAETIWIEKTTDPSGFDLCYDHDLLSKALHPDMLAKLAGKDEEGKYWFPKSDKGMLWVRGGVQRRHVTTNEELATVALDLKAALQA